MTAHHFPTGSSGGGGPRSIVRLLFHGTRPSTYVVGHHGRWHVGPPLGQRFCQVTWERLMWRRSGYAFSPATSAAHVGPRSRLRLLRRGAGIDAGRQQESRGADAWHRQHLPRGRSQSCGRVRDRWRISGPSPRTGRGPSPRNSAERLPARGVPTRPDPAGVPVVSGVDQCPSFRCQTPSTPIWGR